MITIDEKIDKYLKQQQIDEKFPPGDMWKEDKAFEESFLSLDEIFSNMWKQVKKFDRKHKTKVWNKISKDMFKLEGLVNDVGTDVINMMKKAKDDV
jgi:hypothetical protein